MKRILLLFLVFKLSISLYGLELDYNKIIPPELNENDSAIYEIWLQAYGCIEFRLKKDGNINIEMGLITKRSYVKRDFWELRYPYNYFSYTYRVYSYEECQSKWLLGQLEDMTKIEDGPHIYSESNHQFFRVYKYTKDTIIVNTIYPDMKDLTPTDFFQLLNCLDHSLGIRNNYTNFYRSLPKGMYEYKNRVSLYKKNRFSEPHIELPYLNSEALKSNCSLDKLKITKVVND